MTVKPLSLELTLLVPGIMRFEDESLREFFTQAERLPGLEFLLSRGQQSTSNTPNLETTLAQLFGLTSTLETPLPVAALSNFLYCGEVNNNWFMHCDPVLVQVNRDHLLLMGNELLEITTDEAEQLIADINKLYDDQTWQLKMLSPTQWVLETQSVPAITTNTLKNAVGKKINNYLPAGDDAAAWHALLNELQMFLHSHPVNLAREAKGLPVINSVWFWGEGKLPQDMQIADKSSWAQCWSNHTLSLALANLTKVTRADCPDTANNWFEQLQFAQSPMSGQHLVVLDSLQLTGRDPYDWWQALSQLDQTWLSPLIEALREKKITRLVLDNAEGRSYELTRLLAGRWWKRIKPMV